MSDSSTPILLYGDSFSHPSIFYRTRFWAPDPVIVVDEGGKTTLWVSQLEYGRAQKEAQVDAVKCWNDLKKVEERFPSLKDAAPELRTAGLMAMICEEHKISLVNVDTDFPALHADWMRAAGIGVTPQRSPLYTEMRRVKTPAEVRDITAAQDTGFRAMRKVISLLRHAKIGGDGLLYRNQKDLAAGRPLTGDDLISLVEVDLMKNGFTTSDTICAGGPESADPHRSSSPVVRAGLPIVLDIFPRGKQSGEWGDMTRTVVRGTPPEEVQKMFAAVREAQQAALRMARPGVACADLHNRAVEVLAQHGYETPGQSTVKSDGKFIHSLGHGVGLAIHEDPRLARTSKDVLQVGDVFTLEPGVYNPAIGGVRIEDTYVMTANGSKNVATRPVQKRQLVLS